MKLCNDVTTMFGTTSSPSNQTKLSRYSLPPRHDRADKKVSCDLCRITYTNNLFRRKDTPFCILTNSVRAQEAGGWVGEGETGVVLLTFTFTIWRWHWWWRVAPVSPWSSNSARFICRQISSAEKTRQWMRQVEKFTLSVYVLFLFFTK